MRELNRMTHEATTKRTASTDSAARTAAIQESGRIRKTLARSDEVEKRAIPALKKAGYIK